MQTPQHNASVIASFHEDLKHVKENIYDRCGMVCSNPLVHSESTAYAACSFELNHKKIQHRCSKITPTKTGQFVTIWKRNSEGVTEPFDISDGIDFMIITSRQDDQLGQFIFPVSVLIEKGIVSKNGKGGKRGIRVYPPWDKPESKQALATQRWQSDFFIYASKDDPSNPDRIKQLFNT